MSNPYRELFAVPGARDFALAGLLARLPLPMAAIGIITMLSQLRGGYALALFPQAGPLAAALLLLGGLATVMTTLPLLLVDSIAALVGTVLVAGLCFAPIMIVAMSLVERLLPRRSLTEGMTWLLSGLNVGVALGITVAGQVVDASGPQAGFTVALCAAAVLLLVALWGQQRLREQAAAEASVW